MTLEGAPPPAPPNAALIEILPTPELTLGWLERLELLQNGPYNQFVSLQVITMAKEAFKAFQNGAKPPKLFSDAAPELVSNFTLQTDQNSLISQHFAMLSIENVPVAAGIFRPCGNFGAECVYIDLFISNTAGRGYGAQLLHQIELYCVQRWGSVLNGGIKALSTEGAAEFWRKCGFKQLEDDGKKLAKNVLLLRENIDNVVQNM